MQDFPPPDPIYPPDILIIFDNISNKPSYISPPRILHIAYLNLSMKFPYHKLLLLR